MGKVFFSKGKIMGNGMGYWGKMWGFNQNEQLQNLNYHHNLNYHNNNTNIYIDNY